MKPITRSARTAALAAALTLLVACSLAAWNAARRPAPPVAREADRPAPRAEAVAHASPAPVAAIRAVAAAHDAPRGGATARGSAARPPGADPTVAGMRIAIDPETGSPGVPEAARHEPLTIEELQTLARREAEGLVTVRHPDGSESIEHEGRFTDYVVMWTGPDGKPVFGCAHGEHGAHRAMQVRPSRTTPEEE